MKKTGSKKSRDTVPLILKLLNNSLLLVMMRKIYFAQILAFTFKKNVGDFIFMLQPFILSFLMPTFAFKYIHPLLIAEAFRPALWASGGMLVNRQSGVPVLPAVLIPYSSPSTPQC
jgi:hypothetical protein